MRVHRCSGKLGTKGNPNMGWGHMKWLRQVKRGRLGDVETATGSLRRLAGRSHERIAAIKSL